eukprot:m.360318 g.360318  ORF g.360318 m.360318 type:complete len:98 (-) comp19954_c3_seq1:60-353(-)
MAAPPPPPPPPPPAKAEEAPADAPVREKKRKRSGKASKPKSKKLTGLLSKWNAIREEEQATDQFDVHVSFHEEKKQKQIQEWLSRQVTAGWQACALA